MEKCTMCQQENKDQKEWENQDIKARKECRHKINRISLGVLLYNAIMLFVAMAGSIGQFFYILLKNPNIIVDDDNIEEIFMQYMGESGASSIWGIGIGILFLLIFFRKDGIRKRFFQSKHTLKVKTGLSLFTLFMAPQLIFTVMSWGAEKGLNAIGYTIMSDIESACGMSTTISMFLYASILGPIAEEVVYRGFVMKSLSKYGKGFAIIVSSIFFGLMHGNLLQGAFAFCVGIVLGYVAIEYSIKWSIAFHICNNLLFGDLLAYVIKGLSQNMQQWLQNGIMGGFFVLALAIFFFNFGRIKTYWKENKPGRLYVCCLVTSIFFWIFIGLELALGLCGITKIG